MSAATSLTVDGTAGSPAAPPGPRPMCQFAVIAGLSGAGRSVAVHHLGDLGWFAIDNLPPELASRVVDLAQAPESPIGRVALAVRSGTYQGQVLPMLGWLRSSAPQVRVLFLDAATETLVRRYGAARRRHPLSGGGREEQLVAAIEREREVLAPVRAQADVVVDTSGLTVHELRRRIGAEFGGADGQPVTVSLLSFGYKYAPPPDADLVLDCRFLPNPHWISRLRPHSGLDQDVRDYVLSQGAALTFLDHLENQLARLLPVYAAEGKACLTVALGCTGGRHRSVAMAEQAAVLLHRMGFSASVRHRDVAR